MSQSVMPSCTSVTETGTSCTGEGDTRADYRLKIEIILPTFGTVGFTL